MDRHEQAAEKLELLTVNKAVSRSHQSVPETHVPARTHEENDIDQTHQEKENKQRYPHCF